MIVDIVRFIFGSFWTWLGALVPHPDLNGGIDTEFKLVNKARAILARHHQPS